jgi:ribosome maturation factor RimP
MSRREEYETKTERLLEPIAQENGVSVYDVEYVKEGTDYYLRAYIDKPEGVNIQDCENVSRRLSDELDREDFISDAYILEVSSPGLGRTLKKEKHLQASIGQEVEVKLFRPIEKCRDFSGILKSFDTDTLTILIEDTAMTFQRADIAVIRLAIDF